MTAPEHFERCNSNGIQPDVPRLPRFRLGQAHEVAGPIHSGPIQAVLLTKQDLLLPPEADLCDTWTPRKRIENEGK